MLCVSAEDALAAAAAAAVASDKMRSVTLGGSIQRAVRRMTGGGGGRRKTGGSARAGSGDASASCSGVGSFLLDDQSSLLVSLPGASLDDTSIVSGKMEGRRRCSMRQYRSQLEQEVKKLQRQLQEEIDLHLALADAITYNAALVLKSSIKLPDKLSEEMVRSMKDIFLHLSASSKMSPEATFANSSSSAERLSGSTMTSLSDSSVIASVLCSPSVDLHHDDGTIDEDRNFDPYNVNGKESRRDIGSYCSVTEVSWMYIGTEQLEYACGALKKFRLLVEQLSKVDPCSMNCDERLAFWINLYNALIMHAFLAYGVPENDMKLFSLMQKACYTVGGQPVSAAEIEFVILKMKTPVHRPQLVLTK
nr:unnamed protein product [Digitaria exilis]